MLKYLIKKGYVNVPKLLIENYPQLGLNEQELVVLLKLFEMLKNNQASISVNTLAKKTSMNTNDISGILNELFNRGIVTINLEYTKQGKTKEYFNLDECINLISSYFEKEMQDLMIMQNESSLKQITGMVEETFHRPVTPSELQMILEWCNNGENLSTIKKALAIATTNNKLNLKYVDACLIKLNQKEDEDELDESKSKLLSDFYRKIK